MKKLLFGALVLVLGSCADSKTFQIDANTTYSAEPYGWANYEAKKDTAVVYEPCIGNVVWSIILCQTVFIPVWLTGWELYEPVRMKNPEFYTKNYKYSTEPNE